MLSKAFNEHYPDSQFNILPSIGSGGAVRGAVSGRIDIGLMARPLKDKEKQYGMNVVHYADTALVFVVSKGHRVKNIDISMLKALYRGEGTVHGLKLILRPKLDSDTLLLEAQLSDLRPVLASAYQRKGVPVGMTDQSTIGLLLRSRDAISTSTLSLIVSEKHPVQMLDLNGVSPSLENLSNGSYPLQKSLYMVHDGQLTDREHQFVEFVFSLQGKEILIRTGHVPVAMDK